jgi:hypothetical protein
MVYIIKQYIFFIVVILISLQSNAQIEDLEDEYTDTQLWLDYNAQYNLKNNFTLYGDAGWRIISPHLWTRYYIRPAVSFTHFPIIKAKKHLKLVYHFGIGTFYTNYTEIPNNLEIRPFQGINIEWTTLKRLHINQYIRLEQQFEYFNDEWDFGLRARYMLAGTFEFYKNRNNFIDQIYIPFHVEFFWNLNDTQTFNDVIRLTAGLGYVANPKWWFEFSTSYHRRKFEIEDEFSTNDIVFRFRVFHNLN